jgi:UDP-3-O-[3-hydroxymyristoyl] glucosamine N-acyltransferase
MAEQLTVLGGGSAPEVSFRGRTDVIIAALAAADDSAPGVLCFAGSKDYLEKAKAGGAAAVIIPPALEPLLEGLPAVLAQEARLIFVAVLDLVKPSHIPAFPAGESYFSDRQSCQIGPEVIIGPGCYIGSNVTIGTRTVVGPQVFIEDGVTIGSDCLIHPKVVLRWGVTLGQRCQIHSGTVIGEDGFGYNQIPDPQTGRLIHYKNPHLGRVVLGDDVEIGALSAVDRGLVADTVIERGTKLDNLVQIGHNCHLGQDVIVVAQVGCGGHSLVEDRVFLLGQCGLTHGAVVGHDAIVTGQTGVIGKIPPGRTAWSGTPNRPQSQDLRSQAMVLKDLPRWRQFWSKFRKSSSFEELKAALDDDQS